MRESASAMIPSGSSRRQRPNPYKFHLHSVTRNPTTTPNPVSRFMGHGLSPPALAWRPVQLTVFYVDGRRPEYQDARIPGSKVNLDMCALSHSQRCVGGSIRDTVLPCVCREPATPSASFVYPLVGRPSSVALCCNPPSHPRPIVL